LSIDRFLSICSPLTITLYHVLLFFSNPVVVSLCHESKSKTFHPLLCFISLFFELFFCFFTLFSTFFCGMSGRQFSRADRRWVWQKRCNISSLEPLSPIVGYELSVVVTFGESFVFRIGCRARVGGCKGEGKSRTEMLCVSETRDNMQKNKYEMTSCSSLSRTEGVDWSRSLMSLSFRACVCLSTCVCSFCCLVLAAWLVYLSLSLSLSLSPSLECPFSSYNGFSDSL